MRVGVDRGVSFATWEGALLDAQNNFSLWPDTHAVKLTAQITYNDLPPGRLQTAGGSCRHRCGHGQPGQQSITIARGKV